MKTTLKLTTFALVAVFALSLTSCKKRRLNRSTYTSEDNSLAEASFDDVFHVTDEVAQDEGGVNKTHSYSFGACATVTLTPDLPDTTFPKTLTIDFGASNCTGNDGVNRRGKITAVFTGKYRDQGTVITITTQDYYVNDYKVEGTKTVTNNGKNSANNTNFTIDVDGKVTTPDGDEITWKSNRNREWIEGESTTWASHGLSGIFDDVYSITGNGSGINRNDRAFTATITNPLIIQVGCRWIKEGTLELAPEDLEVRTIDFGNRSEGCNNDATVTVKKRTYNIKMR